MLSERSATEWLAPAETNMTDGAGASGAAITSSISLRSIDPDAHAAHHQQTGRTAAAKWG
jgi:hypothetical protein